MKWIRMAALALIVLSFLISVGVYEQLPDEIAVHWNAQGEADGYGSKSQLFLMPSIMLGLFLLMIFLPLIDPLRKHYRHFAGYYDGLILVLVLFFSYIQLISVLWNLGYTFSFNRMFLPAFSVLFLYLGVMLKHAKQNWFVGIRTPWTLSSEKVWAKTHQLGGKLFIGAGIATLGGMLFEPYAIWFMLIPVLLAALGSVVYSYFSYQKRS